MGKREITRYEQFLLLPIVFSKVLYCRHIKTRVCFGKGQNPLIATFQLSSAASLNLGWSQNGVLGNGLTDNRTLAWSKLKTFGDDKRKQAQLFTRRQKFRMIQIERICRRQNKCDSKTGNCFGNGKKHCGKRRKCWFPAFSPFPTMFYELYLSQVRSKLELCGQELT